MKKQEKKERIVNLFFWGFGIFLYFAYMFLELTFIGILMLLMFIIAQGEYNYIRQKYEK